MVKVLVIDDEEPIRRNFKANLMDMGYDVVTAANGQEGLDVYVGEQPDIVLTDLRMPVMDGLEFIKAMKASHPDTPIIVVSGTGTIRDAIDALRKGAWDYMLKPLQNACELEIVIQRTLERAQLLIDNRNHQTHLEALVMKKTKELREMEQHINQVERLEAIGTLAGGIAHDFNNILSVILGYTELAKMQVTDRTEAFNFLQTAHTAINQAIKLVAQIRTFSAQTNHEAQPIQINHLVNEILKFLRASIPSTIEIRQSIASDAIVMADPTEINRILINLCTNAALSMGEGGGILVVRLEDARADQSIVEKYPALAGVGLILLTVSDTGCGMTPEVMSRIFEKFFTTRGDKGGTGMGLAIVHDIVSARGGAIEVMSELGKGTTFQVYLPTVDISSVVSTVTIEEVPVHGSERLLIVDDEQPIVDLMRSMLGPLGYQIQAFTDSRKALAAFEADPQGVDLVLTDITMPYLNGEELVKRIRGIRPDIPVVLHTGDKYCASRDSIVSLEVNEILIKPMEIMRYSKALRRALTKVG